MPTQPRVSILIPNFNNGRASSRSGERDFIGDLLKSLETTLWDEPVPFEVLVFDDGSTDDSIDTLRQWAAEKVWHDGRPFLTLMEAEHCGVLSITANKLSRAARGEFLARLDGDVVCLTPNWVSRLCRVFDEGPPDLGIVGPKQLNVMGVVHEFGDFLLHPLGYHHNGHGLERHAITHAMEVDDTMGCFHCCRKAVFDEIEGYDESFLRGQTVDFGVRSRLAGWRCWAIPNIEYIHAHSERLSRETTADSNDGMFAALDRFEEKWGFHRIAPDLDFVREKFAGTKLLWNARFFGPETEDDPLGHVGRLQPDQTEWKRYRDDRAFASLIELRIKAAMDIRRQASPMDKVLQVGSQCGLIGHLLARQGLTFQGVERSGAKVDLACRMTGADTYPGDRPAFHVQEDRRHVPVDDGWADMVLLYDIMEADRNPVGLVREAQRTLREGGVLVVISQRAQPRLFSAADAVHRYTFEQLYRQLCLIEGLAPLVRPDQDDQSRSDMMIAMQRTPSAAPVGVGA